MARQVIGILLQNFVAMGLATVCWAACGFSLAFGGSNPIIGNFEFAGFYHLHGLRALPGYDDNGPLPLAVACFQMMFAVIARTAHSALPSPCTFH